MVLYFSSGLLADGSELLLLVPSVAGIVGSVVLPILGAVPDGMMVLVSGIGPNAQETLSTGIGALAGSTVMLLTLPWIIAVTAGRVPLKDGVANYKSSAKERAEQKGLTDSGITFDASIQSNAKIMLLTAMLYLVIQVPAAVAEIKYWHGHTLEQQRSEEGHLERWFALTGFILCVLAFVGYIYKCSVEGGDNNKELNKIVELIKSKKIGVGAYIGALNRGGDLSASDRDRVKSVVKPFFVRFDVDNTKKLELPELVTMLSQMGDSEENAANRARKALSEGRVTGDGIDIDQFVDFIVDYIKHGGEGLQNLVVEERGLAEDDDAAEEEVDVPEDIAAMPESKQMQQILLRSCWMMGLGTILILTFSDPMCSTLTNMGKKLNVSSFYVSFVLAPLASNASELLSALKYASKKSKKSITTSLSTLVGAACMNNTFCLAIFMALIFFQRLAWQFTAETVSILLIQLIIGGVVLSGTTQTWAKGFVIFACYPGCLAVTAFLENVCGLD